MPASHKAESQSYAAIVQKGFGPNLFGRNIMKIYMHEVVGAQRPTNSAASISGGLVDWRVA